MVGQQQIVHYVDAIRCIDASIFVKLSKFVSLIISLLLKLHIEVSLYFQREREGEQLISRRHLTSPEAAKYLLPPLPLLHTRRFYWTCNVRMRKQRGERRDGEGKKSICLLVRTYST